MDTARPASSTTRTIRMQDANTFRVDFPYSATIVAAIKQVHPHWIYRNEGDERYWTFPTEESVARSLIVFATRHGFQVSPWALRRLRELHDPETVASRNCMREVFIGRDRP